MPDDLGPYCWDGNSRLMTATVRVINSGILDQLPG